MSLAKYGTFDRGLLRIVKNAELTKIVKYRVHVKRAPYLSTFGRHNPTGEKFLTFSEMKQLDIAAFDKEGKELIRPTFGRDMLNPNVETNFGRSGRIDRPRPARDTAGWQVTMDKYEKWLEPQKDAEFLRRLPNMMIAPDSSKIVHSYAGLLDPDKSTDKELVYIKMSGNYHVHYIGVRHESWLNRLALVPLFGGSGKWNRRIKALNLFFYANMAVSLALPFTCIASMTQLALGSAATWSSLMPISPMAFFATMVTTNLINGALFYLQNYNRLVKAVWFEPESLAVCVELHNWFAMFNWQRNYYGSNNDIARVIKIPYKFLSSSLYGPEQRGRIFQFDFAHVETGGTSTGMLNSNLTNMIEDMSLATDLVMHGKCFMLPSMPVNEEQLDNIELLAPFDQLLDHFHERVTPANPEMIPELDLSAEAINEFYEMEDFTFGEERFERERIRQNVNL